MTIRELEPKVLWEYFDDITKIPRPSRKEEKLIDYLFAFAEKQKLTIKKDTVGNVLISKPATSGYENRKPILMQSHLDMVCEKNKDTHHNFETDPIQTFLADGWVKAKGTTLGADDGIGVAAQLAVLASNELKHGPIEALFTVDEESGMTGAFGLKKKFFESKILLNLDSEDEGELYIGCAGGKDTTATFFFEAKKVTKGIAYRLNLKGLKGGHSGDEIHKGHGNSIKLLNRFLFELYDIMKLRVSKFEGGNLRNAIPREAYAEVVIPKKKEGEFLELVNEFEKIIASELKDVAPNLSFSAEEIELPEKVMDKHTTEALIMALYACPHGAMRFSDTIPGLVETSTNLASVKFTEYDEIIITTSQRSSVETAKDDIVNQVHTVFMLAGADVESSDGYPGWTPNNNSEILRLSAESYKKLFNKDAAVKAIHAGLECGLFLEKYPDLDMVSFGPTVKGAHSPDERLEINSVPKFWNLLTDILENAPQK